MTVYYKLANVLKERKEISVIKQKCSVHIASDGNKNLSGAIFIQQWSSGTYQAVEKDIILLAKERKNDMIELEY